MTVEKDLYASACLCFDILKDEYIATGVAVTISAVAKRAKVDRKYFYGHINTPQASLREKWLNLGSAIRSFKLQAKQECIQSCAPTDAEKLQSALVENYSLVEKSSRLQDAVDRLKKNFSASQRRIAELETQLITVQRFVKPLETSPAPALAQASAQTQILPTIISPDSFRQGNDRLDIKKAWIAAMHRLRATIGTSGDADLYITVGAPGSGKSTWCRTFSSTSRQSILFDACNVTKTDRYDFFDIISGVPGIKIIAVVFCIPIETLRDRNLNRPINDQLPLDKIDSIHSSIEYPGMFDANEVFDEIIMMR